MSRDSIVSDTGCALTARLRMTCSICERSPLIITFELGPIRVMNILICMGVVFWASSSNTKALLRVRPRI